MEKAELLAPAGSYEAFLGAVNAGADAIYLGSKEYGARAYAENFDPEQVILALRYAHLRKVKIYLTVNTLMQESEILSLPGFLRPFYDEGLDGVIVQDIGAVSLILSEFPGMEVHASTQMSVTSPEGALFLKNKGVSRVVPARELSLLETKAICDTGISVEVFIHGAMCYSFSGRCLMSSLIGGRSGNRGRCAQPCRLSYEGVGGNCSNLLSLRDMTTIDILPELLRAGVSSLKIEGRMKKPEYAAGVTAIYRRALDDIYSTGSVKEPEAYMENLKKLYIRSDTGSGYYKDKTGPSMLTKQDPGYRGTDREYFDVVRKLYLDKENKLPVTIAVKCKAGEAFCVSASYGTGKDKTAVSARGVVVEPAQKRAVSKEDIKKHILALGDTDFYCENIDLDVDDNIFIPICTIKQVRREAISLLLNELLKGYTAAGVFKAVKTPKKINDHKKRPRKDSVFSIYFESPDQLRDALEHSILEKTGRIYLPWECFDFLSQTDLSAFKDKGIDILAAFPDVMKGMEQKDKRKLIDGAADGFLLRDIDSIGLLFANGFTEPCDNGQSLEKAPLNKTPLLVGDSSLYCWNSYSKSLYSSLGIIPTAPLEFGKNQYGALDIQGMEFCMYGRIPLMISANCVAKNSGHCLMEAGAFPHRAGNLSKDGDSLLSKTVEGDLQKTFNSVNFTSIRDRKGAELPVKLNCGRCYNVIYSDKPLSLHEYSRSAVKGRPCALRLSFTNEIPVVIKKILDYFDKAFYLDLGQIKAADGVKFDFPVDYTTGNYKRPVE